MRGDKNIIGKLCCICDPGANYPNHVRYQEILGCRWYKPKNTNMTWLRKGTIGVITGICENLNTQPAPRIFSVKVMNKEGPEEIIIEKYGIRIINIDRLCPLCPNEKKHERE